MGPVASVGQEGAKPQGSAGGTHSGPPVAPAAQDRTFALFQPLLRRNAKGGPVSVMPIAPSRWPLPAAPAAGRGRRGPGLPTPTPNHRPAAPVSAPRAPRAAALPPRRPAPTWASIDEEGPLPPTPESSFSQNGGSPGPNGGPSGQPDSPPPPPPRRRLDRDDFMEACRVHLRTSFDFERWGAHRSTRRYVRHMFGIAHSRMLRGLAAPLAASAALATAVGAGHEALDAGVITLPAPLVSVLLLNSAIPMSLTSSVLGLLLVFRTNASYARWLDARKSWGLLLNRSRDLARQGLTWAPPDTRGAALRGLLCRWIVAHAYALKAHLREGEDAAAEIAALGLLPEAEAAALAAAAHRPVYALQVLSEVVREVSEAAPAAGPAVANMEVNLTALEDVVGTCERILKTPIPLSYTRHTSRFMIIWLSWLPFALWEPCGWGSVPLAVAISLLTLGVESIGVIIEEPFSILPLEAIVATVRADVGQLQACAGTGEGEGPGGMVPAAALVRRATGGGGGAGEPPGAAHNGSG